MLRQLTDSVVTTIESNQFPASVEHDQQNAKSTKNNERQLHCASISTYSTSYKRRKRCCTQCRNAMIMIPYKKKHSMWPLRK